jgi:hypothetical protein
MSADSAKVDDDATGTTCGREIMTEAKRVAG